MTFNVKKMQNLCTLDQTCPNDYFMKDSQNILNKIQDVKQKKRPGSRIRPEAKFRNSHNSQNKFGKPKSGTQSKNFLIHE